MSSPWSIQTAIVSCLWLLLSGPVLGVSTPPIVTTDPPGHEAIQRSPRQTLVVTRYRSNGEPVVHVPGPNRLYPAEDWGTFDQSGHAVYVLAGADTVIGRWRSPAGKKYLISNTHPSNHTAFSAKTRPEFESFLGYAERTSWVSVCEVQNPLTESCESPPPAVVERVTVKALDPSNDCIFGYGTGCKTKDPKPPEPPSPPSPPKPPPSSGGGLGYCGASVAICQAYDDTFGRAPEAGQGPAFWDQWLIDHGVSTESQEFQTEFEAGCQNDDCDALKKKHDQENSIQE